MDSYKDVPHNYFKPLTVRPPKLGNWPFSDYKISYFGPKLPIVKFPPINYPQPGKSCIVGKYHHHAHAPSWSVAVSTKCFQCSLSWVYFHAELRPRLRGIYGCSWHATYRSRYTEHAWWNFWPLAKQYFHHRRYYSAAHWQLSSVILIKITFLWFLLFSMCKSLNIVNLCIN